MHHRVFGIYPAAGIDDQWPGAVAPRAKAALNGFAEVLVLDAQDLEQVAPARLVVVAAERKAMAGS